MILDLHAAAADLVALVVVLTESSRFLGLGVALG